MGVTLLHRGYILFVSFTALSPLLCQTGTDQAIQNHISFLPLSPRPSYSPPNHPKQAAASPGPFSKAAFPHNV
jgi:hypothetical protein